MNGSAWPRADTGTMRIFGRSVPEALPEIAHRVGAIVESPQFFGNFTGRRTLRLLASAGGVPAGVGDLADPTWITPTLAKHQLWVAELTPLTPDLESVFLELTGTAPAPGRHLQVDDAVLPPAPAPPEPALNEPVLRPAAPIEPGVGA